MQNPASDKIWTGSLILLLGVVVTAFSMMASGSSGFVVVAWGAMLFGFVRILSGLFQLGASSRAGAADDLIPDVTEEVRTLVAVTSAMVLDPEAPTPAELAAIQSCLRNAGRAFGYIVRSFSNDVLQMVAKAMKTEPDGAAGYLRKKSKYLNENAKEFIAKSALSVLLAHREPGEATALFLQIVKAMGFGDEQASALLVRLTNVRPNSAATAG
jgi:hypothetical protein